jgi:hypothetical protein
MKKIIIALSLLSAVHGQIWTSQIGDMLKSIYDTNNDGIVDRADSASATSFAILAGTASNAYYAVWSMSNSNSIWADGAGNTIMFDGQYADYYTNLTNTIGLLTTNRIADLDAFISIFVAGSTNGIPEMIIAGDLASTNYTIAGLLASSNFTIAGDLAGTNYTVASILSVSNLSWGLYTNASNHTVAATNELSEKIDGVSNFAIDNNILALLTNGSRAMSGNLDMGSFEITNASALRSYSSSLYLGDSADKGLIWLQNGNMIIDSGLNISLGTLTSITNTISLGHENTASVNINVVPTDSNHAARLFEVWDSTNKLTNVEYLNFQTSNFYLNRTNHYGDISNISMILPAGSSSMTIGNLAADNGSIVLGSGNVSIGGYSSTYIGASNVGEIIIGSSTAGESTTIYGEAITIDPSGSILTVQSGSDPALFYGDFNYNSGEITNIKLIPNSSNCATSKYYVDSVDKQMNVTIRGAAYVADKITSSSWALTGTLQSVYINSDATNTGADLYLDIRKNGVSIFSNANDMPRILDGTNQGFTQTFTNAAFSPHDVYWYDIKQVGSTVAGGDDLRIVLKYRAN